MRIQVAPSLLSADILHLEKEVLSVRGCDYLHIDVMDGDFVPNITYGPALVRALARLGVPQDVHLMISQPARHVDAFIDAGAAILTIHAEADVHLHRTLSHIRNRGVKAGVSLNPSTPLGVLDHVWEQLDLVLIMTVNPGFGGQSFILPLLEKIRACRRLMDAQNRPDMILEVDGGIDRNTAKPVVEAGARMLVSGSALFAAPNRKEFIEYLQSL